MREVVGKQNNNAKAIYKINKNMSYLSQLIFFFPEYAYICIFVSTLTFTKMKMEFKWNILACFRMNIVVSFISFCCFEPLCTTKMLIRAWYVFRNRQVKKVSTTGVEFFYIFFSLSNLNSYFDSLSWREQITKAHF